VDADADADANMMVVVVVVVGSKCSSRRVRCGWMIDEYVVQLIHFCFSSVVVTVGIVVVFGR